MQSARSNPEFENGSQSKRVAIRIGLILSSLFLLVLASGACTRSTIPIDATSSVISTPTFEQAPEATPVVESVFRTSGNYAVVWIPEGNTLKLRVPAGISGSVVDELEYDTRGVRITGNTTSLGSSLWVEVLGPDGESGWVNSWNLTEDVPVAEFCSAPQILASLETITQAFLEKDSQTLSGLVNPTRGLILRHDWWNPEVIIRAEDIPNLFTSREEKLWGTLSGGDFTIEGTFNEIFAPIISDVMSQVPTAVCGEIPSGVTSRPSIWPGEYENLHFYAFHRANPQGGNRFDWRTLVLGFEFSEGKPYLTLLVHYHGDI